jgi:hypothetical protein
VANARAAPHTLYSLRGLGQAAAEHDSQHSEPVFHLYLSDSRHPSGSLETPTGKA